MGHGVNEDELAYVSSLTAGLVNYAVRSPGIRSMIGRTGSTEHGTARSCELELTRNMRISTPTDLLRPYGTGVTLGGAGCVGDEGATAGGGSEPDSSTGTSTASMATDRNDGSEPPTTDSRLHLDYEIGTLGTRHLVTHRRDPATRLPSSYPLATLRGGTRGARRGPQGGYRPAFVRKDES